MTDTAAPHPMTRAVPGDKRCTVCGLTAQVKAHKAHREAVAAAKHGDQVDAASNAPADVDAPAPAPAESPEDKVSREIYGEPGHVHVFGSTGEAYDASQCRDEIGHGDALLVPAESVAGYLDLAWPIAASTAAGDFHRIAPGDMHAEHVMPAALALAAYHALTGAPADVSMPADVPAVDQVDTVTAGSVPAATTREETNMRFTATRTDLVDALAYVVKGIGRPGVPVLSGVTCTVAGDTLTVHTFNGDTLCAVDLVADGGAAPADGAVIVAGKGFADTVKALPKTAVTVDLVAGTDGSLTVSAAGSVATLPALCELADAAAWPLPAVDHAIGTVASDALAALAGAVAAGATTDDTLPTLSAVRVRTNGNVIEFATTDRYRLHFAETVWSPATDGDGYTVAPGSEYLPAAKPLVAFAALVGKRHGKVPAPVTVSVGSTLAGGMSAPVYALTAGAYRIALTCVDSSGFPAVERVMPAESAFQGMVTVPAGALVDLVKRVTAARKPKDNLPVILKFAGDTLTADYTINDDKRATGSMPAGDITGDAPEYIGFNPAYLVSAIDAVTAGKGDNVTFKLVDRMRPAVLVGGMSGVRVLVMPIRVTLPTDDDKRVAAAGAAVRDALAAKSPAPAVKVIRAHAFTPSADNAHRCGADGCDAGRTASFHREARTTEKAATVARIAAGAPAAVPAATVPAVVDQVATVPAPATSGTVELMGPIVASVDAVKIGSGTAVVANGSTLGYVASIARRYRVDGFDLMTGGQFTTHYASGAVAPAVIGATVCERPYRTCSCARMLHVTASDMRRLPRLAPAVDQVDTVPAPAPRPYTLPAHLLATIDTLHALATETGFDSRELYVPAGSGTGLDGKPTRSDSVTLEISTPAKYRQSDKWDHHVIGWCSWTDHVTNTTGTALHTIDQVRAYLVAYAERLVSGPYRVSGDGMDACYRAATGQGMYGNALQRKAFSAAPAPVPADFAPYMADLDGCACKRCAALAAAIGSGEGVDALAVELLAALASGLHLRKVAPAPVRKVAPAVRKVATVPAAPVASVPAPAAVPAATVPVTVDQVASVPAPATAGTVKLTAETYAGTVAALVATPAGELTADASTVDTLHGACPADVDVFERGTVAGYRFNLVAGTRGKSLASDVIRPALRVAGYAALVSVTAPKGSRTVNVVPKDGATVEDWSAVLAVVAEHIGAALALADA